MTGTALVKVATGLASTALSDPAHLSIRLLDKTGLACLPEEFIREARTLVGNLSVSSSVVGRTFGLCSSREGEGVSTVCAALTVACATARVGKILLVDANFARPLAFSSASRPGFSDLLLGQCDLADAVQVLDDGPVHLLGAGTAGGELPAQVSDDRIARTIQDIRAAFAVTIVDLAPPRPMPFSLRVARALDGVVLAVEAHRTERAEVEATVQALRRAQAPLSGLVYNRRRFQS